LAYPTKASRYARKNSTEWTEMKTYEDLPVEVEQLTKELTAISLLLTGN
jgi:hypothetical protein